jgi:hypothetical protein
LRGLVGNGSGGGNYVREVTRKRFQNQFGSAEALRYNEAIIGYGGCGIVW